MSKNILGICTFIGIFVLENINVEGMKRPYWGDTYSTDKRPNIEEASEELEIAILKYLKKTRYLQTKEEPKDEIWSAVPLDRYEVIKGVDYDERVEERSALEQIVADKPLSSDGRQKQNFIKCEVYSPVSYHKYIKDKHEGAFNEYQRIEYTKKDRKKYGNKIPKESTDLGDECFAHCRQISEISIPRSIVSLGNNCFASCCKLSMIVIPDSVTSMGYSSFAGCHTLSDMIILRGLTSLGNNCFASCCNLSRIVIPDSVLSFGNNCFASCGNLSRIVIPDSVLSLGNNCFGYCENLKNITLPSGLISIGSNCFYNCSSLSYINFPSQLISIGSNCFAYCKSLVSLTIPSSVTSLGNRCFRACRSLTSILFPTTFVPTKQNLKDLGIYLTRCKILEEQSTTEEDPYIEQRFKI